MIRDRRKTQSKAMQAPKKISQADRSVATGRAKRDAAIKAKRGISKTKKANNMQIDQEVKRQAQKTAAAKKRSEKTVPTGRSKANKTQRKTTPKNKSKDINAPAADAVQVFGGRVPSKKAIEAALRGMKDAGFSVPPGHQVVMTFIPSGPSESTKVQSSQGKDKGKKARGGGSRRNK
mmetsp:Transcript_26760/g.65059  ORF Transcript_26760/g.65059 Transcript_26760/m.65059 type:complete len:177 (-) Transcript_26760:4570-5100(-)|eukprot:CAMPEP_0113659532 /NCGR_PEP_ID=MMETSP0017_2-20120614/32409_1 /TAXON_ID=2856 /ORGANISM="Cylindrotheca closterium" /LENGTH=176 /DNA_ID=CAMNT_0000574091 /DNA_START=310 /DNA_END=840 /DNA_ORIENTATION=+ /assembly_acc=CAM_ASM_000147